jgi:hypothetical protein
MLVGGAEDPDNFNDLVHAPQWTQELVDNNGRSAPSRFQWVCQKFVDGSQLEKLIMVNADIALVRDLEGNMTSASLGNSEVVPGQVTTCQFRCGDKERLTGCPNRDPPVCPIAGATFGKASKYNLDNDLFLRDFQAVM